MARLETTHSGLKGVYSIYLDDYPPINEPHTLDEVLNQFIGEPNNEITRQRIRFALENWYVRTGEYVRFEDLNLG
jgi:hypothetical protein